MMKKYNTVLTIAGSDSGGGAGIQADIKTISACGCYATSAITAITVQNTLGVKMVSAVAPDVIAQQIDAVLSDIGADAVKVGMLNSADVVEAVIMKLEAYKAKNIVLDPVMVSTSGHRLIEEKAVSLLVGQLMPMTRVITPNIPEAEILLGGCKLEEVDSLPDAARDLAQKIGTSVLLKAGHLAGDRLVDILYDVEQGRIYELPSIRVNSRNTHGTGCTMSSALASMLAKGSSLHDASVAAKRFINDAILAGADYEIGHGIGPVKHFHAWWK